MALAEAASLSKHISSLKTGNEFKLHKPLGFSSCHLSNKAFNLLVIICYQVTQIFRFFFVSSV
ncbi:hypothetical protein NSTC731_02934 [Nostoc sp. DSM 114167]|jgi:hypothetical protein